MRPDTKRCMTRIGLLTIACLLSINGCAKRPPDIQPGLDTARCDPKTRTDCVSVSEAFLANRLGENERITRCQLDLKACRQQTR